ncbi:hypothetical protein A8990_12021 [Paenibacillus taihuensis]|uniref:Uncharacterized protein n=1 Tax=Paenibacillus taihuensis TaxID=1156355 RepID=A0A3D9RWB7_9BACL|nr:hypothetical protein A8990_12021 [Paenibacillus taihuensis]
MEKGLLSSRLARGRSFFCDGWLWPVRRRLDSRDQREGKASLAAREHVNCLLREEKASLSSEKKALVCELNSPPPRRPRLQLSPRRHSPTAIASSRQPHRPTSIAVIPPPRHHRLNANSHRHGPDASPSPATELRRRDIKSERRNFLLSAGNACILAAERLNILLTARRGGFNGEILSLRDGISYSQRATRAFSLLRD